MGLLLLPFFEGVTILHEHEEIFVNLASEDLPLKNEYVFRLEAFKTSGGNFRVEKLSLEILKDKIDKGYQVVIPIEKIPGKSHLINLVSYDEQGWSAYDNKL
jgi:hypothetical protein